MLSKIKKWGNSAAIRLPANLLNGAGLSIHCVVDIDVIDDQIVIKRSHENPPRIHLPFTEAELLKNLNEHSAHSDELANILPAENDSN